MTRWPNLWTLLTGESPKQPTPADAARTLSTYGHSKRRRKIQATCDRLRAEMGR